MISHVVGWGWRIRTGTATEKILMNKDENFFMNSIHVSCDYVFDKYNLK